MRLAYLVLLTSASASLAACAGTTIARRPAPAPRAPWVVHPDAEVKDVKNPHDHKGAPLCQRCHSGPDGRLVVADSSDLCYQCHEAARMTHVNKIQKPPPKTLPYEAGGRIVCSTCHEVHDVGAHEYGFRAEHMSVCIECHARH